MPDNDFEKHWIDVGETIAMGGKIGLSDLYAIYDNADVSHILPVYLDAYYKYEMARIDRKKYLFGLAKDYWGLSEEDWIAKERVWFNKSLDIIKWLPKHSLKIEGVASVEVLFNLIFASKIVTEDKNDRKVSWEAVTAVNLTLGELCTKGRTMMTDEDDSLILTCIIESGMLIGFGGDLFLPYPEKYLPELLLMLNRDKITNKLIYDDHE